MLCNVILCHVEPRVAPSFTIAAGVPATHSISSYLFLFCFFLPFTLLLSLSPTTPLFTYPSLVILVLSHSNFFLVQLSNLAEPFSFENSNISIPLIQSK